jgi:hypothetical protein
MVGSSVWPLPGISKPSVPILLHPYSEGLWAHQSRYVHCRCISCKRVNENAAMPSRSPPDQGCVNFMPLSCRVDARVSLRLSHMRGVVLQKPVWELSYARSKKSSKPSRGRTSSRAHCGVLCKGHRDLLLLESSVSLPASPVATEALVGLFSRAAHGPANKRGPLGWVSRSALGRVSASRLNCTKTALDCMWALGRSCS